MVCLPFQSSNRRSPLAFLCAAMVLAMCASSCTYDNVSEVYPDNFCETEGVSWSQDVLPLMVSRCATPGCHVSNGFGPGDFSTYSAVRASVDDGSFRNEVIVVGSMPPSGRLADCDIQKLEAWIAAGAPEN